MTTVSTNTHTPRARASQTHARSRRYNAIKASQRDAHAKQVAHGVILALEHERPGVFYFGIALERELSFAIRQHESVGAARLVHIACALMSTAQWRRCTRGIVTLTRDRMANDGASMTAAAGDISIGALIDDLKVRGRAWRRDLRMRVAHRAFDRSIVDRSFDRLSHVLSSRERVSARGLT
jgi:hypothetical protein